MESISKSFTILLKLNIVDLIGLLYLKQMIGVSELLKLFGIDEITELSLQILCKSINSIPLLVNVILIKCRLWLTSESI